MKIFNALATLSKKLDDVPMERLEANRVRTTIESYCDKYLKSVDDELMFEALPSAIDATIEVLEEKKFQEKFEFMQVSDTCFVVRLRELDLLI